MHSYHPSRRVQPQSSHVHGHAEPSEPPDSPRSTHFMRSDMTKPKVLVVENDGLVRECTTELLDEAGFEVIEARDAQEALIRLQHEDGIRVLFTNAELPLARDGIELFRRVQKRWPEIGLVITSGHALLASTDLPDSGRFIANTARPEVLVKVIEQAAQVPP